MKNLKKVLALLLVLAMVFALAACGSKDAEPAPEEETEGEGEEAEGEAEGEGEEAPAEVTFDKPIKMIIPYAAGGGVYNVAVIVAAEASEILGQTIDVVCMEGNNGQEGIEYVYNQASDGYTLLATDNILISTALQEDVIYKLDEFTPIAEMQSVIPTVFVKADSPFESMEQLIEEAKARPGEISIAHGKVNAPPHLPIILLEKESGADFNEVPTSGGSEAKAFVLGGNVDVGSSVPSTVSAEVEAGELRVLAVSDDNRVEIFPDAPTFKELGYDISMPSWYSIFCKSDVPAEVQKALEDAFVQAMQSETAIETAAGANIQLSGKGAEESKGIYEETITNLEKLLAE